MTDRIKYTDLLQCVTEKTGTSKEQVLELMNGIVDVIRQGLERDGRVVIRGLGRFELRWQESHMGRNPQTGEEMEIPAHSHVHFRPESALSRFINRKYAHLKIKWLTDEKAVESPIVEAAPQTEREIPIQEPVTEKASGREGRRMRWLWLIPVVILVLIIIFWPRSKPAPETDEMANAPVAEQKQEEEKPEAAPEKPAAESVSGIPSANHRIRSGEMLWGLSDRYYGDVYLWPHSISPDRIR